MVVTWSDESSMLAFQENDGAALPAAAPRNAVQGRRVSKVPQHESGTKRGDWLQLFVPPAMSHPKWLRTCKAEFKKLTLQS